MKYVCELCGWVYDETKGCPERKIAPGTFFAHLPEEFECPHCGCGKEAFDRQDARTDIRNMTMQSK